MIEAQEAQIAQAQKDVSSGRVQRIAVPGQWRVFKDAEGRVVTERFEAAYVRDVGGEPSSNRDDT